VLFTLMFTSLVVISNITLVFLNESRIDVYISLSILAYYVSHALSRPSTTYKPVRILNIALFVLFAVIVAYRVYEVFIS